MFSEGKVTEILFMADEFCKVFNRIMSKYAIQDTSKPAKHKYHRDSTISDASYVQREGRATQLYGTLGNVNDRKPLEDKRFIEQIFDKLIADIGNISKVLFQKLFVDGKQLITILFYKNKSFSCYKQILR